MVTLHQDMTLDDVTMGTARAVICPDCGQMEIWSVEELADHGKCRTRVGDPCRECGETEEPS